MRLIPRNGRSSIILTLLLAAGLLSSSACAQGDDTAGRAAAEKTAADAGTTGKLWTEAPGYDLYVGKDEDPDVRVFQSPDFRSLLVLPGAGDHAYLLALRKKEVTRLPRTAITATLDGALVSDPSGETPGALARDEADLSWSGAGGACRLVPEPPLIGAVSVEDLLKKKRDYASAVRLYQPKRAAASVLKSIDQPVEIVVFFGTWCHLCKKWLPRFIRTMEEVGNPGFTVRYVGIDEDLSQPEEEIAAYAISRTPTFVVKTGGRELGRIEEEPEKSMEEDLVRLLLGVK